MSGRVRSGLAAALAVLAGLALVAAIAASYTRRVAVDENQFADRAVIALQSPAVRTLVARRVTDDLVVHHASNLLAARPLIQTVVAGAIGGRAFGDLFRVAVRDVHRAVFDRDENTVTLTLADAGTVAASALDVVKPSLAKQLRVTKRVQLVKDNLGSVSGAAVRVTDRIRLLALLLGLVALLASAGAVALAPDRRRAVTGLGVSFAVSGVLLAVAWGIARTLVVDGVPGSEDRAAVGAVWDAFLDPLRVEAWILAGLGAVLAAAAASLLHTVSIGGPVRAVVRAASAEPRHRWAKALRAALLIAAGVACLLDRGAVIALLFTALGAALVYFGVGMMLELINLPVGAREGRALERIPGRRAALATLLVAGASAAAVAVFLGSGGLSARGPAPAPCNGSRLLCDRPLTDVALATTHNAMSVPLPGWYSAEQEAPIPEQLDAGIRGLLVDTYYADRLANGRLRTDLTPKLEHADAMQVTPQARDAALRLRARLGFKGSGRRGLYLCHGFCELGGTPLSTVLDQIHDFLVAHPEQVLVVVNEDYITPKSFVRAVDAAGLGSMAFTPLANGAWPTLREMIDSGHRIVFLAENQAGGAPWYRPAYRSLVMETPYHFSRVPQLTSPGKRAASCAPNRGPKRDAPLFLVNNWVTTTPTPRPGDAAKVNALGPLLARLRACERLRGHIPNLVGVNFYRRGDVLGAVDALNGVPDPDGGG